MIAITALLQNLVHTFEPIAVLCANRLRLAKETENIQIKASLEYALPTFVSFLIRCLYFFENATLIVDAQQHTTPTHNELHLRLILPKFDFNPNLLLSTQEQKILELDSSAESTNVVFVKVMLPYDATQVPIQPSPPLMAQPENSSQLDAKYLIQNFEKRFQLAASDHLTLDKLKAGSHTKEALLLEQVQGIILQNIEREDFTSDELLKTIGLSKAQLFRHLKKTTGFSTANYIRYVRLCHAQELLRQTQLSISEVAFRVGFRDLSYFTHSFKEQFDCSPSEWRQEKMKQ